MEIINQFQSEIVTALLSVIILIFGWFLRPKVNLKYGVSHGYLHKIDRLKEDIGPETNIQTVSHIVTNGGSKAAHNVELVFNYPPDGFEVWPVREYKQKTDKDGRLFLIFSYLPPKNYISINVIMIDLTAPTLLNVSCEEMTGKLIEFEPCRKFSKIFQFTILVFLLMGMFLSIYLVIKFIMLIAGLTT